MSDDLAAFAAEYHGDKVSQKYALAAINNLGDKVRDVAWQVSGNKAEVNTSLKSLSQKLLTEVSQLHSTTKSNHTSLLEAVKGIKEGLTELARAMTSMSSPVGMPSGSVPETPMTPGPKASMAPPSEYVSPSVAAAPPMATYGQPGYSSQSFNQRGKEILLDHLLDHLLGHLLEHLLEELPCCLLRQSVSQPRRIGQTSSDSCEPYCSRSECSSQP